MARAETVSARAGDRQQVLRPSEAEARDASRHEQRIDRQTPLGNPFLMGEHGRDETLREAVCCAFEELLRGPPDANLAEIAARQRCN